MKYLPFGQRNAAPSNYKRHLATHHRSSLHLGGGRGQLTKVFPPVSPWAIDDVRKAYKKPDLSQTFRLGNKTTNPIQSHSCPTV